MPFGTRYSVLNWNNEIEIRYRICYKNCVGDGNEKNVFVQRTKFAFISVDKEKKKNKKKRRSFSLGNREKRTRDTTRGGKRERMLDNARRKRPRVTLALRRSSECVDAGVRVFLEF